MSNRTIISPADHRRGYATALLEPKDVEKARATGFLPIALREIVANRFNQAMNEALVQDGEAVSIEVFVRTGPLVPEPLREPEEFLLLEAHCKLLRQAYVQWPHIAISDWHLGESNHLKTIADILGVEPAVDDYYSEEQKEMIARFHKGLPTALQIILCTGAFEPGHYKQAEKYNSRSWVKA